MIRAVRAWLGKGGDPQRYRGPGLLLAFLLALAGCAGGPGAHLAGAPAPLSKSSAAYERQRRALVRDDSARAFDAAIVLTPAERRANRKLVQLRQQLVAHYDSINYFPPAHNFFRARRQMYTTRLYRLLLAMPKGGVHHLHPNAGASPWWLVQRALREPNCYVYWGPASAQYLKGQLRFFRAGEVPAGFYAAGALNDTVCHFPQKLHHLLTFDATTGRDSADVWRAFEQCFQRMNGFTSYQPVFRDMYVAMFDSLAADGVQHVELRASLNSSLYDLYHLAGAFPADSIIRYLQQAQQQVRTGREPAFTLRLIYTNLRFRTAAAIRADVAQAYQLRRRYPDLVAAYDLVAHEDAGHSTDYFRAVWLARDSLAAAFGTDLPLCLHDGESTWRHTANLYDAALLHSRRIGHGFNLSFFPAAEELVRRNNICVEVSPLSNQILGYIGDLRMHPAHAWLRHGIQISISPDDPGIFDYVGVTPDYWAATLAWELDLRDLKKLSLNGIDYSFLSPAEKKIARAAWQPQWDAFVVRLNQE